MKEELNQLDSQGLPHGLWEDHWSDGTLSWRGHYLHGKKHGHWENYYWWSNGTLMWRGYYLHGKEHGVWEDYRKDGTLSRKRYHLRIR